MTRIEIEDIVGPCAVTVISSLQMGTFARRVGYARSKFKVSPPETTGNENFVRVYRAHQNSVEFFPLFLSGLWTSSLMLHQVPSCLFGVIYIIGRQKYFSGYSESTEKRMSGFKISIAGLQGLWLCSILGLAHQGFIAFTGKTILNYFS